MSGLVLRTFQKIWHRSWLHVGKRIQMLGPISAKSYRCYYTISQPFLHQCLWCLPREQLLRTLYCHQSLPVQVHWCLQEMTLEKPQKPPKNTGQEVSSSALTGVTDPSRALFRLRGYHKNWFLGQLNKLISLGYYKEYKLGKEKKKL